MICHLRIQSYEPLFLEISLKYPKFLQETRSEKGYQGKSVPWPDDLGRLSKELIRTLIVMCAVFLPAKSTGSENHQAFTYRIPNGGQSLSDLRSILWFDDLQDRAKVNRRGRKQES